MSDVATIPLYATSAQCWGTSSWTGTVAPSNAAALLRAASILVRDATASVIYPADTSGMPTDTDILDALRDATCAHAAALEAAGVNPTAAGTTPGIGATAIGSASVTYAGAGEAATNRLRLAVELAPEAQMILRSAGLLGNPPLVYRA